MKYILFNVMLLAGTVSLHAESVENDTRNKLKDPLYFQLYGGINKSANENLPWTEFSKYPWAAGAFIGVGKEFTPVWGWHVAFRYNRNKSRNVQECESPDTWSWDNLGLFADVTLDLTDAICRRNLKEGKKYRRWNVKAFAGIGGGYTFNFTEVPLSYSDPYNRGSQVVGGARAGITATYRVAKNWRVGAELSHTMFLDNFNGVEAGMPFDARTNLSVGVTYLVGKRKKHEEPINVEYDTRLRVIPVLPYILPAVEDVKVRRIFGRAFIDFPVNETVINPNYRRNPQELRRILATVDSALFDRSMQVTSISLHGYASPESSYSNNARLSKGRAASLQSYLQKHYSFKSSLFVLENTPEDWDNLRNFIAAGDRKRVKGDVWYESQNIFDTPETPEVILNNRDELLRVIDMQIEKDEKEEMLKRVGNGEPYKWLIKYVYPGLRHTDYIIEYVVRHYPVKEARRLIYTHPEALSTNEMYQVANSYSVGSDGWLDALLIAAKQYPEDETANLNAACACVRVKRLKDAKRYLLMAGDSDQSRYLDCVIRAMDGSAKWRMDNGKVVLIP